jgi:hypothetical protein
MADFEVKIDYNKLDRMVRRMGFKVEDLIEKTARDTASQASANTVRVDTGLMKNSWDARKEGRFSWAVGDYGCGYAWFHEHGFHHWITSAWIPATPMLLPAFTQQWDVFTRSLNRAGVLL